MYNTNNIAIAPNDWGFCGVLVEPNQLCYDAANLSKATGSFSCIYIDLKIKL